jgi:hypothetical protein
VSQPTANTTPTAPQWWILGQHQYSTYEMAQMKNLQMRDDGHITKITANAKKTIFTVHIFCT